MSTKLWDYYGGEPFMENPHLAIIGANPKKKGQKNMATKRRGKKNSPKRRARRNPWPLAGIAINRPRRKRRTKTYSMNKKRGVYAHNPRGRRRRRHHVTHRRNPAVLGVALPPMAMIAWGAGGFIGAPMIESYLTRFLPAEVTTSVLGRYAVKIGTVLGLTYLTKQLMGNKEAFPVALGGSLYVVVSAVNEFAPQLTTVPAPTAPVKAYRSGMINAYRSGMIKGIGAYSQSGLATALPGLAYPSETMGEWEISNMGMNNPVFADPRFANSPLVAR